MSIKIGQKLPDCTLYKLGKSGPETTKLSSLYTNRKLAIFALPGAFTPTCSHSHLPTIIEAFSWITRVAFWAEKINHHPEWFNVYRTVRVVLTTHDVKGLSNLDLELAEKMDGEAS